MKVGELIEKLKNIDPEINVILSVDPEGNGYSPLNDVCENNRYDEKSGGIGLEYLTDELKKRGFDEEDIAPEEWPKAVILWP